MWPKSLHRFDVPSKFRFRLQLHNNSASRVTRKANHRVSSSREYWINRHFAACASLITGQLNFSISFYQRNSKRLNALAGDAIPYSSSLRRTRSASDGFGPPRAVCWIASEKLADAFTKRPVDLVSEQLLGRHVVVQSQLPKRRFRFVDLLLRNTAFGIDFDLHGEL